MQTRVIGSDLDERYWFHARIVGRREPYRELFGVPAGVNPWALRARFVVRRFSPAWGGWTPQDGGLLVDLFRQDAKTRERDGQYERILESVVCVVAETSAQARARAKTYLEHGAFCEFELRAIERAAATQIESTPAATKAIEHQKAVHPLIGGEYTPHVPELHVAVDTGREIEGAVRLELTNEQLEAQIARAREHRQRVYDWGRFKLSFELEQPTNERLLTILRAISENDRGTLIGSVALTDDTPEVAVTLVVDEWVDRLLDWARHRSIDGNETAQWKIPVAESSIQRFLTHANTAVETETPTVVGPSRFLDPTETTLIAAM